MKHLFLKLFPACLTLLLILTGCGKGPEKSTTQSPAKEHAGEGHETEKSAAAEYRRGKGISLSEEARKTMGIETLEVGLAPEVGTRTLSAQVFRLPDEKSAGRYRSGFAYASGWVDIGEIRGMARGQKFSFTTATGQDSTAELLRIEESMKKVNGQAELIFEIAPPTNTVVHGDTLQTRWEQKGGGVREAVFIPKEALLETARGHFVYVLNGEHYIKTPVVPGEEREGKVSIVEGLFEGDVVVSRGAQQLHLTELQALNAGTGCTHGH